MNAFSALFFGKEVHIDVARAVDAIRNGTFGTDTFVRGTGSAPTVPNHPGGDGTFDGVEGKKYTDMLSPVPQCVCALLRRPGAEATPVCL